MKYNHWYLYRLLVLFLSVIIISIKGQLLGGLLSSSDGGLITSVLGGGGSGSTTTTTTGGGSTTTGSGGPIIDIDLGPISLELYLAIQDPANQVKFISWTHQYNKTYTASEFQKRYKIYVDNSLYVNSFNTTYPNSTFQVGLNQFADLTLAEFITIYVSGLKIPNNATTSTSITTTPLTSTGNPTTTDGTTTITSTSGGLSNSNLPSERSLLEVTPTSADWRYKLPPVKYQGSCGSCYAFSVVATLEALFYDYIGIVPLSEQEIIDCSPLNSGCSGGFPEYVYDYVIENGITGDNSNRYTGQESYCEQMDPRYKFVKYQLAYEDETDLYHSVLSLGPVSVIVYSRTRDWQFYQSGIYNSIECGNFLDHAVTIVGLGTENGINYWIVRNSWGQNWGEEGYIRIQRDVNCVHNGRIPRE